jgi:lipopolysaccharide export system ATP-binding protein
LRATHLAKAYKKRQVISDLSVEVESGQIVGLLGPNGAGKTTAFYMIVGLVPPDRGTVTIDDRDITHLPMHQRARSGIGYLPQEASVFRKLSVEDNVMAILETRELDETARQERLEQILGELRIAHVRKSLGMALSGGERRRVEIARALAAEPRFVLLDEPFAGVDPLSVIDIQRIMTELTAKGIGVLCAAGCRRRPPRRRRAQLRGPTRGRSLVTDQRTAHQGRRFRLGRYRHHPVEAP